MPRCDYDSIFYRVFCITLLGIAFTFTVILTNVFIDIDGILAKKDRGKTDKTTEPSDTPETVINNEIVHEKDLETQTDSFFQEEEQTKMTNKKEMQTQMVTNEKVQTEYMSQKEVQKEIANREDMKTDMVTNEEMQTENVFHKEDNNTGIIFHEEVQAENIFQEEEQTKMSNKEEMQRDIDFHGKETQTETVFHGEDINTEMIFHEEMPKKAELYGVKPEREGDEEGYRTKRSLEPKTPDIMIQTEIDTKTVDNGNDTTLNANSSDIKDLIKLIYNGRPVNFSPMDEDQSIKEDKIKHTTVKNLESKEPIIEKIDDKEQCAGSIVDNFVDKALVKYFEKHPKIGSKFTNKRLKRHTKARGRKSSEKEDKKKDDDELYVEIETHLDGSGINNEKKKELIKNLVEKIQKAVDANTKKNKSSKEKNNNSKKKNKFVHVRKRLQNPLKNKDVNPTVNKVLIPLDDVLFRNSEPIGNSIINSLRLEKPSMYPLYPYKPVGDKFSHGSRFLSRAKSINSDEKGTADIDYEHVLKEIGIPQRLQKPINTENINEQADLDNYKSRSGDMKLYMKEIDGSGISIGFNQYVGEAPDPDSIKLYTGLQELITDYHKNYQNANVVESDYTGNTEINHELRKRDVQDAIIDTNINNNDYHFNEYKVIFDQNSLPYDSYSEIIDNEVQKVSLSLVKDESPESTVLNNKTKSSQSVVLDGNLLMQKLNPSQIFSLANFLHRKKRSIKLTKYSDLNTRTKINQYVKLRTFNTLTA